MIVAARVAFLTVPPIAVIVALILVRRRKRDRLGALRRHAAASGWSYVAKDDRQCDWWTRSPFGEGFDRSCANVLSGQFRKHPMLAFDYTYKTGSSSRTESAVEIGIDIGLAVLSGGPVSAAGTTETHHFRVCALALPIALPNLEVTPASSFSAVRHLLGMHDVRLESEDFNRRFRVHADNPKFAYDVLTPRTMQALLALEPYTWRIEGGTIVSWAPGVNDVPDLLGRLTALAAVADGIPAFVWHDRSVPPAPVATISADVVPRRAEASHGVAPHARGRHEAPRRV